MRLNCAYWSFRSPSNYNFYNDIFIPDHAHHGTEAYTSLNEFVAFDDAIQKAVDMTSESDTLIIVTADHSHTFNIGGYAVRGNPLFGNAQFIFLY